MTSPSDSAHSFPSATNVTSVATTNVRKAGSSAGGASSLLAACPLDELLPFAASACSAASSAFTSSAISFLTSGLSFAVSAAGGATASQPATSVPSPSSGYNNPSAAPACASYAARRLAATR